MANARAVAVAESTDTLERHVSMSCSGTRNLNVWTRCVLVGGGAVAFSVRTGIRMVPKTPLWSKNAVVKGGGSLYLVSTVLWIPNGEVTDARRHVAWPGWCGGVKVGVSAPSHLKNGRNARGHYSAWSVSRHPKVPLII